MAGSIDDVLDEMLNPVQKLDFLAEIPCPVKLAFHDVYDAYERNHGGYVSYLPTTCGLTETVPGQEILKQFREGMKIPDLILTFGFREFFDPAFVGRQMSSELRCTRSLDGLRPEFQGLGLEDPEGVFTVFSTLPMVLVIDDRHIGNLPIPRKWCDLLDPVYKGAISISGGNGQVEDMPLAYFYKNFGEDGVIRLARNVKQVLSGSTVAKIVGSNRAETTPIYFTTWFFANACNNKKHARVVIPEDGAFLSIVYLTAKKGLTKPLQDLEEFLLSPECLRIWEENYYPVPASNVASALPKGISFQWLGWDFIRSHNMASLSQKLEALFMHYMNK